MGSQQTKKETVFTFKPSDSELSIGFLKIRLEKCSTYWRKIIKDRDWSFLISLKIGIVCLIIEICHLNDVDIKYVSQMNWPNLTKFMAGNAKKIKEKTILRIKEWNTSYKANGLN